MSPRLPEPSSPIAPYIVAFLRHKRALNRRYDVEDKVLRMFDGYLNAQAVTNLIEITPALLDAFFLSRPRSRPRSFNHLIGVVGRLFEWMVEHDFIDRSPVTMKPRRRGSPRPPCILDLRTAQQLIDRAAELPDQVKLDDPSFNAPITAALWPSEKEGEYALIWNRPKREA